MIALPRTYRRYYTPLLSRILPGIPLKGRMREFKESTLQHRPVVARKVARCRDKSNFAKLRQESQITNLPGMALVGNLKFYF